MSTLEINFKGQDGVGQIINNIKVEMNELNETTNKAKESGTGFFGGLLQSAGGFLAANVVGAVTQQVGNFIGSIGQVTKDEQDQMAQLQAGLDSTGGKAGVTIDMLTKLAQSQADQTKFSVAQTEAIEKVGLTFTSINKDVFPQTVQLAEDMSQRLGIQGSAAMTMLGKAADDPIKGMTALHRTGTSFTEQQVEQIKALTASGDKLGAYQIILHEVAAEYGGSATAAAKTFSGQQEILAHQMDEVKVKIGTAVLPVLGQLTGFVSSNLVPILSEAADWFAAKLPIAINYVTNTVIPNLIQVWNNLQPTIRLVVGIIQDVIAQFQSGGAASTQFGIQIDALATTWKQLQPVITNVVNAVSDVIQSVFGVVHDFIQAHGTDIAAFMKDAWKQIQEIIKLSIQLYDAIVPPVLHAIANFIKEHGTQIQAILTSAWNGIKAGIDAALTLIKGIITVALDLIHGDWSKAWEDIKTMSARIVLDIVDILKADLEILKTVFSGAIKWINDEWHKLPGQLSDVGSAIVGAIKSGIETEWGKLVDWFNTKLQQLKDKLPFSEPKDSTSPLYGLGRSGQSIVRNIQDGIGAAPQLAVGGPIIGGASTTHGSAPRVSQTANTTGTSGNSFTIVFDDGGKAWLRNFIRIEVNDVIRSSGNKSLSRQRSGG